MGRLTLLSIMMCGMVSAPLSAVNAQLPSCSVKDAATGQDCLSASLLARTEHADGAHNYAYKFTNTCDRSFDLTMDTGKGQTKVKSFWIGKRNSEGPKMGIWNCISGYNGAGDCQNIGWTYDCLQQSD